MTVRLLRRHLRALCLDAERYLRRGFLPEDLVAELAEAKSALWQLTGGDPDA